MVVGVVESGGAKGRSFHSTHATSHALATDARRGVNQFAHSRSALHVLTGYRSGWAEICLI